MNYRHIYHAGNFADVMKHLALALCIDYLLRKDKPFCVIDAHGGIGRYDLSGEQAGKTMEWAGGIGKFVEIENPPEDLNLYLRAVSKDMGKGFYPGSPMIAARMLRTGDRLIANELHPEDFVTLKKNMSGFKNTTIESRDAYECLRAHLPPKERRGLVLIDPPFEKTDEFETLIRQMSAWKKRWADGIYLLWYPIKAHLKVADLRAAATGLGLPDTWCFECLKFPEDTPESFNGSGLIIFNAPYTLPERLEALLPVLKSKMGLFDARLVPLQAADQ